VKTIRTMSVSDLFSKIWQFFLLLDFNTLQDKNYAYKTGQDHVHIYCLYMQWFYSTVD